MSWDACCGRRDRLDEIVVMAALLRDEAVSIDLELVSDIECCLADVLLPAFILRDRLLHAMMAI